MAKINLPSLSNDISHLPADLASTAALAVQDILAEASSANTTRSYTSALRYWAAWHQVRFNASMLFPVSEAIVIQFIVDHPEMAWLMNFHMIWIRPWCNLA